MITLKELYENFIYNEGKLFWRKKPSNRVDISKPAGALNLNKKKGVKRWVIKFKGKFYKRSRLVFFYFHRRWPDPKAVHVNGNSLDDRIVNLKEVTRSKEKEDFQCKE